MSSFLTLEFGEPQLQIDSEPRELTHHPVDGERFIVRRRLVQLHGEWHLWIYVCDWVLTVDGRELARSDSDDLTIHISLDVLNGQALSSVSVEPDSGSCVFRFDLGCVLSTMPSPVEDYGHDTVDQWIFFQPSGETLSFRSDRSFEIEQPLVEG
ncbi:MAG: hypothetical protein ACRBK7_14980 [Acidimicrobiales bacterium]